MLRRGWLTLLVVLGFAGGVAAQTITWTYPTGTAATSFSVWRSQQASGTCPAPARIAPSLPITQFTYKDTDPALVKGATYCYTVTAFNTAIESPASNVLTYTVPLPPATLVSITATLSFQGGGAGGTVASNPAGIAISNSGPAIAQFPVGSTVTFTATPKGNNSRFAGWGDDCAGAGLARQCTLASLQTPARISAQFVK